MSLAPLTEAAVATEIARCVEFLRAGLADTRGAVLGLSGGIDSDVVARLLRRAVAPQRIKCFTVIQADMEDRHLRQARELAAELDLCLVELPLAGWAWGLIDALAVADPQEGFSTAAFLDVGRAKNSLRGTIYSTYHDRGYITIGTSNRTELECGFFVRFGDGQWHLGPIAHLYKTYVFQLAAALGSRPEVIAQPPSAGYWQGQSDLEDLGFWLVHGAPIGAQRGFTAGEIAAAAAYAADLDYPRLDAALARLAAGERDLARLAAASGLRIDTATRLGLLVAAARWGKGRPAGVTLSPLPD
ncbi:MAG: NAD(+) synthase [Betaproteobacteria bacterium]|nr:NAD(+) synthase [Betaproteobacteria bacterium]